MAEPKTNTQDREGIYNRFIEQQKEIFFDLQNHGFNVVTCGHCDTIIFHRRDNAETVFCGVCNKDMAKSDCPDYHY